MSGVASYPQMLVCQSEVSTSCSPLSRVSVADYCGLVHAVEACKLMFSLSGQPSLTLQKSGERRAGLIDY